VIARAALTVHSTSISIVGIALTVLAALVLLVWWARTWRKGRNEAARGPHEHGRSPQAGPARPPSPPPPPTWPLGTGVSRLTGLLRIVALAWALGQTTWPTPSTWPTHAQHALRHRARRVLSATFIPVFVDQLSNRDEDEAFDSISAVLSVSVVVLVTTTVARLVLAPVHSSPR
jgi:hypothetical protein